MQGFKATGILPFNPNIFTDAHFLQHQQCMAEEEQETNNREEPNSPTARSPDPSTTVSPKDIRPIPTLTLPSTSSSRAGSAVLVSGSPFKTALIESMNKKKKGKALSFEGPSTSGEKTGKALKKPPAPKKRKTKKSKEISSSSEDEEELQYVSTDDSDSSCDEEDNDAECSICKGLYSNDCHGETWLKCVICYKWFHEKCDNRKMKKSKSYLCVECS